MIAIPAYIAVRFAERFFGFFDHWYRGGTRFFWSRTAGVLSGLDGTFAVVLTVRHLFEPLYQDRTFIGYVLGFIFRVLRVALGISIYLIVSAVAFVLYIGWIFTPIFSVYKVFEGIIF